MGQELLVVGKRLPRPDGVEKATGSAKFTGDIELPGMLIGKVLRSPYPHARIIKINASKAKDLPGVEAVITFEDVPRKRFNMAIAPEEMLPPRARGGPRDQYVLSDKARFVGDAIAAVAATNRSVADEALELIDVEYEQLPALLDTTEAMKPGAVRIHDFAEGNIVESITDPFPTGDVRKGFQEADVTVEETFSTTKQKHCQLEPTACVAGFDMTGGLTVWSPCQLMHHARRKIADIFDIPEVKIRWLTPAVGGAFGGKLSFTNEPICIVLAKKSGKPVKLEDTREEDFVAHESSQRLTLRGKLGVKRDGTITAIEARLIADAGAYLTNSGATTRLGLGRLLRLYKSLSTAGGVDIVYTNTHVCGGFRGYGNTEAMFALEQLIDMAAEKIGMDPVEFRLKNTKKTGDTDSPPNVTIENSALDDCIKVGAERIGWKKKRGGRKEGRRRRGVAMACTGHVSGAQSGLLEHSNAFIKLNSDGSANLLVSPCESGQGSLGVLAQIAAEELGLNIEDIHVVTGDTNVTMFDIGTHASRATYVIGNAVMLAAREAKGQLLERASKALGVPAEELEIKERRIYIKRSPEKGIPVAEVARDAVYNFEGECLNISGKCSFTPEKSPAFQAAFAEVEVDTETGEAKLLKIVIADDIGRAINPMNVEGQLEGGVAQGIGYALTEDFIIDGRTGATMTDSFATYKIPSVLDLPEIEVLLVEQPVASGPFGAKGVGEMGAICIAPAIANAIYEAVGVRITALPITPEKIFKALHPK